MPVVRLESLLAEAGKGMEKPDAIIDPYNLSFIWVNERATYKYGYSPLDVIGKTILDFMPGGLGPKQLSEKILAGNHPEKIAIKGKSGQEFELSIDHRLVKSGDRTYFVVKFRD